MANPKVYVVMERDFDYNDEVYSTNAGGNNVIGYMTRERADAEALRMNIEDIKQNGGYQYQGYSACDNFKETTELEELLDSIVRREDENGDEGYTYENLEDYYLYEEIMSHIKNLSNEEIKIVVDALKTPAYYVGEVGVAA